MQELKDIITKIKFWVDEDSFLWLSAAGVVVPVYNATEPRVALSQNAKSSLFKLYASDVGLLTCQYGNAMRMKILTGDQSVNLGGVETAYVLANCNVYREGKMLYMPAYMCTFIRETVPLPILPPI